MALSRTAALQVRWRSGPHHRFAQPFATHVAHHLERPRTHRCQLYAALGLTFRVIDPPPVPGAVAHRLDFADDLYAAHLLGVRRVLQPYKVTAELIAASGDFHCAPTRVIKP